MQECSPDRFLITPQQALDAARDAGLDDRRLAFSGVAVLTFSKGVMDRLEERCSLADTEWLSPLHHPYAVSHVVKRGTFQGLEIVALVPPMGASPLACIVEDVVTCGVTAVFLVCAAWSLGTPVQFGDLVVPAFSIGTDGTSVHYGNTSGRVSADEAVVEALSVACRERGATVHVGGNGSCEALYRITPRMAENFRGHGCLSVENGEASTLFAMARALGFIAGVLFQPYIDLECGWEPVRLHEARYRDTCHLQADIVLAAAVRLKRQGMLGEE